MSDEIIKDGENSGTENKCPVCDKPIDECTCGCCKPPENDCNCGCCKPPENDCNCGTCKPCPELPRRGTPFYHLPQWGPSDLCDWFVKMNISMMSIDSALHNMDLKIMRQPGELECMIKNLRADVQDLTAIVNCNGSSIIELKDRMDAVTTSTEALQETINLQQSQISNLDTRVTTSELNVAAMQTRVANLDANFSKVTSEFGLLKQDFATLNLAVQEIKDAQDGINERVTTVEDALEEEITRSTGKDEELKLSIDALKEVDTELISKDRELEAKNLTQDGLIQNNSSRIDALSNDLRSAQNNIVTVKSDIVDLQRENERTAETLEQHADDISSLQEKDGVLENNISQNTINITTLTDTVGTLVDTESGHDTRLDNLEQKTTELETEIDSIDTRVTTLEESDATQGEKIATLEENDATVGNTLTAINSSIGTHGTKISKLESDTASLENRIAELEGGEIKIQNALNPFNLFEGMTKNANIEPFTIEMSKNSIDVNASNITSTINKYYNEHGIFYTVKLSGDINLGATGMAGNYPLRAKIKIPTSGGIVNYESLYSRNSVLVYFTASGPGSNYVTSACATWNMENAQTLVVEISFNIMTNSMSGISSFILNMREPFIIPIKTKN